MINMRIGFQQAPKVTEKKHLEATRRPQDRTCHLQCQAIAQPPKPWNGKLQHFRHQPSPSIINLLASHLKLPSWRSGFLEFTALRHPMAYRSKYWLLDRLGAKRPSSWYTRAENKAILHHLNLGTIHKYYTNHNYTTSTTSTRIVGYAGKVSLKRSCTLLHVWWAKLSIRRELMPTVSSQGTNSARSERLQGTIFASSPAGDEATAGCRLQMISTNTWCQFTDRPKSLMHQPYRIVVYGNSW